MISIGRPIELNITLFCPRMALGHCDYANVSEICTRLRDYLDNNILSSHKILLVNLKIMQELHYLADWEITREIITRCCSSAILSSYWLHMSRNLSAWDFSLVSSCFLKPSSAVFILCKARLQKIMIIKNKYSSLNKHTVQPYPLILQCLGPSFSAYS